jgi:hypothetical protein
VPEGRTKLQITKRKLHKHPINITSIDSHMILHTTLQGCWRWRRPANRIWLHATFRPGRRAAMTTRQRSKKDLALIYSNTKQTRPAFGRRCGKKFSSARLHRFRLPHSRLYASDEYDPEVFPFIGPSVVTAAADMAHQNAGSKANIPYLATVGFQAHTHTVTTASNPAL